MRQQLRSIPWPHDIKKPSQKLTFIFIFILGRWVIVGVFISELRLEFVFLCYRRNWVNLNMVLMGKQFHQVLTSIGFLFAILHTDDRLQGDVGAWYAHTEWRQHDRL